MKSIKVVQIDKRGSTLLARLTPTGHKAEYGVSIPGFRGLLQTFPNATAARLWAQRNFHGTIKFN